MLAEPEDAANMILFLSSPASSWITGQTYPVNGGYHLPFDASFAAAITSSVIFFTCSPTLVSWFFKNSD